MWAKKAADQGSVEGKRLLQNLKGAKGKEFMAGIKELREQGGLEDKTSKGDRACQVGQIVAPTLETLLYAIV